MLQLFEVVRWWFILTNSKCPTSNTIVKNQNSNTRRNLTLPRIRKNNRHRNWLFYYYVFWWFTTTWDILTLYVFHYFDTFQKIATPTRPSCCRFGHTCWGCTVTFSIRNWTWLLSSQGTNSVGYQHAGKAPPSGDRVKKVSGHAHHVCSVGACGRNAQDKCHPALLSRGGLIRLPLEALFGFLNWERRRK